MSAASAPIVLLGSASIARSVRIESYDPISQTLSTLAADGRGEWIMTAGLAISAGCQIVTAVGLRVLPLLPRIALALAGCCGLAVAALPDRLGTATAHVAATGLAATLLAIWPLLMVPTIRPISWTRRVRRSVLVSAVLVGMLLWMGYDAWRGIQLGLSERAAATAEMLWPLIVVVSARRRLRRQTRSGATVSADHN
ncbi:hypothetical protein AWB91_15065 [Mycobacterium paraense]|uniref:DUF998 domain-containing protein n=1 Tax=Mycobacterium paraense TaxID=767916 RepID=A0ABX3VNU3_9MYCO|nr:DUF998 domain-containing protein [Mycobacterium paraense]ORW31600.1 hypothetical protein AWB91_15065 [Mycobacterium paraense]ORW42789.1 hypothetical protein AWB88_08625 [Mycobacterium paraense]